jgi:hypothetical protein
MSPENALLLRDAVRVSSGTCLNCDATLTGAFCAECGQRDVPPYPSVRDLVVDAFWELSGWDGRFASTMRTLVERPGKLTREFLEGRRASYISPLRLYLMASLVYFLLAAVLPSVTPKPIVTFTGIANANTSVAATSGVVVSRPQRVITAATGALATQKALNPVEREKALKDIAKAPAVLQPFLRRAVEDPTGFRKGVLDAMPRMLFVLLPIFAGIVALFYRGRKYPEHLYFAIHFHAFIFLALGATALVRFTRIPVLTGLAGLIAAIWIPIYATLAFRRVYGGSMLGTLAKEVVIAMLYGVTSLAAFLVTLYLVAIAK